MKCRYCGCEIPSGELYCPECGEEVQIVPDYNTGFMELESGAVDAVAMDIVVASYQIDSRDADFKILDYEIASEEYGVGFAKGNEALRDQVQQALNELAEE